MWLLYLQSKDLRIAPSEMIGLVSGSYEAFCFDQAAWYLGTSITQDLNKVGHKKAKGEAGAEAARKRELDKLLGIKASTGTFADPALLFS